MKQVRKRWFILFLCCFLLSHVLSCIYAWFAEKSNSEQLWDVLYIEWQRGAISTGASSRFAAAMSSDEHIGDRAYFERLHAIMQSPDALRTFWSYLKRRALLGAARG